MVPAVLPLFRVSCHPRSRDTRREKQIYALISSIPGPALLCPPFSSGLAWSCPGIFPVVQNVHVPIYYFTNLITFLILRTAIYVHVRVDRNAHFPSTHALLNWVHVRLSLVVILSFLAQHLPESNPLLGISGEKGNQHFDNNLRTQGTEKQHLASGRIKRYLRPVERCRSAESFHRLKRGAGLSRIPPTLTPLAEMDSRRHPPDGAGICSRTTAARSPGS